MATSTTTTTYCTTDPNSSTSCFLDSIPGSEEDPLAITVILKQNPLIITLDGPAIFLISGMLIAGIHFLQPLLVAILIALAPVCLVVHNDFNNYLNLGPGGTPSTFKGYLRINWLKLWTLRDPFLPPPSRQSVEPASGTLNKRALPYRVGPRPSVAGIAPQRQIDQAGSRECYLALRRTLEKHAMKHQQGIGLGTSCLEKHGLGLFGRFPINNTCQGEICHVHNSDHSLHLSLHHDDLEEVLKKGWGQRHPLAWKGWLRMPVPEEFVMIYAPRSMDEVHIVCRIIEAAQWWVVGEKLDIEVLEKA